jgi:hypothetical protein
MGTGCEPTGNLQAGYREEAGDGDSMFFLNVGIDLQLHTASKPKTSTTT